MVAVASKARLPAHTCMSKKYCGFIKNLSTRRSTHYLGIEEREGTGDEKGRLGRKARPNQREDRHSALNSLNASQNKVVP